jgi:hypothetical protein
VSITRSNLPKRKSTTSPSSETRLRPTALLGVVGCSIASRGAFHCVSRSHSLTQPFPCRKATYTLVACGLHTLQTMRSVRNCADLRRLAHSYRPTRRMWGCSLFAKPDNDPELAGVDASGRDRPAVMTPE